MKRCSTCELDKPPDDFYAGRRGAQCKACTRTANRERNAAQRALGRYDHRPYYEANKASYSARARTYRLHHYGITEADFAEMMDRQGGLCAIGAHPFGKRVCIDHDHACCPGTRSCGKCVRGLLCHSHNVALGLFKDDPASLRDALTYLGGDKHA